jgi:hypothetical protein
MTINLEDNNPRIQYSVAQGVTQDTFAVPFEFFNDSDLIVYVDGVLKEEGVDYTITGGDGSTGNIEFVPAIPPEIQQVTGAAGGSQVIIFRRTAIERTSDFSSGADINRAALNEQLDILTAMVADAKDEIDRTIRSNPYEVAPNLSLPAIDDRKGRVLAFHETTGAVLSGPSIASVQTVSDSATAIETAAANIAAIIDAPNQASAAAASAAAALISEGAALVSENAASASASAALASENAAADLLDSFDDRYLGAKTSDPTLDNDGNALLLGALYYNSVDGVMKVYNGSVWLAAFASLAGTLIAANNLSDVANVSASRTNLGLGTISTQAANSVAITGGTITGTTITATGDVTIPDKIVHAGDTNTSIRFPANDTVTVETNGAERLRVDSSGNVGIGTTSPTHVLDVRTLSTGNLLNLRSDGTGGDAAGFAITAEPNIVRLSTTTNLDALAFNTGSSAPERMRITSAGNVGIGKTSPASALDVNGTVTATAFVGVFPAGTKMLFQQTTAPTGWTKDTTHDNKALRVVSGTASSGGSVAFTTAFASKAVTGTVGSTTLTISQMPSHTHNIRSSTDATFSGTSTSQMKTARPVDLFFNSNAMGDTGGGNSHNHSFTGTAINLDVSYVDLIIATKD